VTITPPPINQPTYLYETAEKVLPLFEKEGLRGIIELKFPLISL
jgi:hypothetical protein